MKTAKKKRPDKRLARERSAWRGTWIKQVDAVRSSTLVGSAEAVAWLETLALQNMSDQTIKVYCNGLDSLRLFLDGEKVTRLADVTTDHLDDWRGALMTRELAPSTIDLYLRTARAWFAWLTERAVLFANPAAELILPRVERRLLFVPTPVQVRKMLAAPNPATAFGVRDRAMLETAYATGARREEIIRLDATDVALDAGTIRVTGKGSKERVLPLTKAALHWLTRYTRDVRPKLLKGKLDEPALWIDLHCQRIAGHALDVVVRKSAAKARLRRVSAHTLRRACATHLLQNGAHPYFVKELLGHASMKHLRQYLQLSIADVKAMHQRSKPGQ